MPNRRPTSPAQAAKQTRRSGRPRIGLALAGGGPLGAIYEIGALCALEESIEGLDFCDCDSYIGISAGGFIAAGLANGMSPRMLSAAFIENSVTAPDSFDPAELMHPAWGEFGERLRLLPGLLKSAVWDHWMEGRSLLGAFERLGRALPTGLLSGDALEAQVRRQFALPGRSNDFRELGKRLVLVATDLDSGEAVPFGLPGWDDVPISRAVQASAALPGLFPPVKIAGRHYVDGALKKTLHASLLLQEGVDLLICLNPLVPYESDRDGVPPSSAEAGGQIPHLVDGGLPLVMSQTFRSLIHSRLELGMKRYEHTHPATDILLFEPDHRDAEMFLANTFSYSQRRHLAEHAFQTTRARLRRRAPKLQVALQRHGLSLKLDVLQEPGRRLLSEPAATRTETALRRLRAALSLLEARHA
ncbi:patatin-like phospholipase family protein [Paucibacter sp. DJ2R-2]|uniref:patatin-like phospholipase family protein n=1 Tax=Paucibacter sp. DJ2R-2 TaxID=2893558 RepID=UPI0021E4B51A|nr:patatin-like phospholipase family protein [Paucibacter sp. DJ2R-2]MCV2421767.1 patatin-like phospholipase family protein [Paucibacter sp. DJ4R-1]MCV2438472.1 patatin-like phospholipase family protein [Paucibacter sp. DJ2R-2]